MSYRNLVPKSLDRVSLGEKNRNSPEGMRFCNAVCFDYVPVNRFTSTHVICNSCRNLINMAEKKIKLNVITAEQFLENPMIVYDNPEGGKLQSKKQCKVCNEEKFSSCFESDRNTCKSCRAIQTSTRNKEAVKGYIEDIENIKNNIPGLENFLRGISKDCLVMIVTHYQVGRKATDSKNEMVYNLVQFFKAILDPSMCRGGCGERVVEPLSFCERCKIARPKRKMEKEHEFDQNLDHLVETLEPLNPETEIDRFNKGELTKIARKFNLEFSQEIKKIDLFHMVNKVLVERKEQEKIEEARRQLEITRKKQEEEMSFEDLVIDNFAIQARKTDGFINATQLCKAGNKRFNNWFQNDQTKLLIETLANEIGTPSIELYDIKKGGNDKSAQGSWIHPDLAVHLAQWISPQFGIKVSRWVREIVLTGKTEFESKNDEELLKLQMELQEKNQHIKELKETHKKILQKREYHKFQKGSCFYIIKVDGDRFKIGFDGVDINARFKSYRTSIPEMKVLFMVFSPDANLIEKNMLRRFNDFRVENNHEFLEEISLLELQTSVSTLIQFLKLPHQFVSDEEIQLYNDS